MDEKYRQILFSSIWDKKSTQIKHTYFVTVGFGNARSQTTRVLLEFFKSFCSIIIMYVRMIFFGSVVAYDVLL